MEIEKIRLREKPLLELVMSETLLDIRNDEYKDENGKYEYVFLESIKLNKKRTNWFLTILSHLVEISIGGAGSSYKTKLNIAFKYKGISKRITLNDCDPKLAEQFVEKVKLRTLKLKSKTE